MDERDGMPNHLIDGGAPESAYSLGLAQHRLEARMVLPLGHGVYSAWSSSPARATTTRR